MLYQLNHSQVQTVILRLSLHVVSASPWSGPNCHSEAQSPCCVSFTMVMSKLSFCGSVSMLYQLNHSQVKTVILRLSRHVVSAHHGQVQTVILRLSLHVESS
ncbi:hypothetical protein Bpfe_005955 [Biomphalaria pfeifferi]|uniref:Uncharacterized protein n=1 Tax=Biomphalaria pfeifferi TaxID=112525 RepID=A0AAD8FIP4_BIOPF|nr:hypothetical protein Bpfe_005955 [Biomphalaria pfeifferi]